MPDDNSATARFPTCPVCGSAERDPADLPAAAPGAYAAAMARAVGMEPLALRAALPLWTCRRCRANWHDPWLSPRAAGWLYGRGYPVHRVGWDSQLVWLGRVPSAPLETRAEVWRILRRHFGGTLRYAEHNCPFAGLMFAELDARNGGDGREAYAQGGGGGAPALLADCTLLLEPSPMFWGAGCRSQGRPCRPAARLFERTMPVDEADANGERFDIVGSWFVLDHVMDPTATLMRLLRLGRIVLLQLHPPGWTDIQHLYSLDPAWIDLLARDGIHVREITARADAHGVTQGPRPSIIYMLSLTDDLAWLDAAAGTI